MFLRALLVAGCNNEPDVYMFSNFQKNGEDGLHLAYSEDGLKWTALNNNTSFLKPEAGKDKLMRDPCIIKGADGQFQVVWAVSWNEKGIGYAWSEVLINWSEQQYIPVMEHEPDALNCWAPELFWDKDSGQYMIYWASTIPGRFPDTDGMGDQNYNHPMYYTLTSDLQDFTKDAVLYDHGFNVIDATIQKADGEYVIFLKDENLLPEAVKNTRIATSSTLTSGYSAASEPITNNWVEGPTTIKIDGNWTVYFDRYTEGRMGAVISYDLENWTDITDQISFPEGTRHGTVFTIKRKMLNNLLNHNNS